MDRSISRRRFLAALGATAAIVLLRLNHGDPAHAAEPFEVAHSEADWRRLLGPERFAVLREEATEPPGTSPLNHEKRRGLFACAGCALPVFSSVTKFESGTGWPSFTAPLRHAVGARVDRSFNMDRIAVHCRRCGGHLGHVFDDGPKPAGKRYCINGLALTFKPA